MSAASPDNSPPHDAQPHDAPQPNAPQPNAPHVPISTLLRQVVDTAPGESITIRDIVAAFGERAFGFALILFSLPNTVPVPPGVGTIFGIPTFLLAVQMILGHRRPWLPRMLLDRAIKVADLRRIVDLAEPRLRWIESFCRPRWPLLFTPVMDKVIGVLVLLGSIAVLLPFPGTNFPAAIATVLFSIAVIQEDGVVLAIGIAIMLAGLIYTGAVLGAMAAAVQYAFQWLFG